jgi:hypothetical protein
MALPRLVPGVQSATSRRPVASGGEPVAPPGGATIRKAESAACSGRQRASPPAAAPASSARSRRSASVASPGGGAAENAASALATNSGPASRLPCTEAPGPCALPCQAKVQLSRRIREAEGCDAALAHFQVSGPAKESNSGLASGDDVARTYPRGQQLRAAVTAREARHRLRRDRVYAGEAGRADHPHLAAGGIHGDDARGGPRRGRGEQRGRRQPPGKRPHVSRQAQRRALCGRTT